MRLAIAMRPKRKGTPSGVSPRIIPSAVILSGGAPRRSEGPLYLSFLCLALLLTGCSRPQQSAPFDWNKYPIVGNSAKQEVHYTSFVSANGTFVVDEAGGKVWKFDVKDDAFIRLPIRSDIRTYNPKTQDLDPSVDPEKIPDADFRLFASNEGTFLIESKQGRIWQYGPSAVAFKEIPLTTGIVKFEKGKDGELHEVPQETNSSGKPCDKQNDPLCIR